MRLADLYTAQGNPDRANAYQRQAGCNWPLGTFQQKSPAGSRRGLDSATPLVASQFSIAFKSGETLLDGSQATATARERL